MNPVFDAARETVSGGGFMGAMTVVFLIFFLGWALWAWAPRNRQKMIDAARMPLDDGE